MGYCIWLDFHVEFPQYICLLPQIAPQVLHFASFGSYDRFMEIIYSFL